VSNVKFLVEMIHKLMKFSLLKGNFSSFNILNIEPIFYSFRQENQHSRHGRSIPEFPITTPMCCGSNTVRPDSILTKTGIFSRQSAGGSFQMAENVTAEDMYPPSRIIDLKVRKFRHYEINIHIIINMCV
jgi:hypothetical protein